MSAQRCIKCKEFLDENEIAIGSCRCGMDQNATLLKSRTHIDCGSCTRSVPDDQPVCGYCFRSTAGIELEFPWGCERIRVGEAIELGRDSVTHGHLLEDHNLMAVSKSHCRISFATDEELTLHGRSSETGAVKVEDLGSTNGTFVDGRRVPNRGELLAGLGSTIQLARRKKMSLVLRVSGV